MSGHVVGLDLTEAGQADAGTAQDTARKRRLFDQPPSTTGYPGSALQIMTCNPKRSFSK
jgi:hypothetical protein